MIDLFMAMLGRAPELVGLIVVVWLFIKYLDRRDVLFKELNNENIEARRHSRDVIDKNTATAAANTVAMSEMTLVMRQFLHERHSKRNYHK